MKAQDPRVSSHRVGGTATEHDKVIFCGIRIFLSDYGVVKLYYRMRVNGSL